MERSRCLFLDLSPEIRPSYRRLPQAARTGHFLMMEQPEQFNELLGDFLERIDF